jgi:hypothetical protein
MNKLSPFIATLTGAAILGLAVSAQAFGGHGGHHHGSPALMACMTAAPQTVKANLWSTIKGSSLHTDREAVKTAKDNLAQQIFAKNTSVGSYETALSQAQLKMTQDEDAIAQNVCGQLTASQLAAASTLYTNLQTNKQTVRGYFQTAHQASGAASGSTSSQGADQLPTD